MPLAKTVVRVQSKEDLQKLNGKTIRHVHTTADQNGIFSIFTEDFTWFKIPVEDLSENVYSIVRALGENRQEIYPLGIHDIEGSIFDVGQLPLETWEQLVFEYIDKDLLAEMFVSKFDNSEDFLDLVDDLRRFNVSLYECAKQLILLYNIMFPEDESKK